MILLASLPLLAQPAYSSHSLVNLSNNPAASERAQMAAYNDDVYVAWEDSSPGNVDVFFKRSADRGETFSSALNLSENSGNSLRPRMAADGGHVYVVWQDMTSGVYDIYFIASHDGGATFGDPVIIDTSSGYSLYPRVMAMGDHVYVTWMQESVYDPCECLFDIYFVASEDGGSTWHETVNVSDDSGLSYYPYLAADMKNIYVVWWDSTPSGNPDPTMHDREILFRASHDNGFTWDDTLNLSNTADVSTYANMLARGSTVWLSWYEWDDDNYEVHYTKSTDAGRTFQDKLNLTQNEETDSHWYVPQMILQQDRLYMLWDEGVDPDYEIVFAKMPQLDADSDPDEIKQAFFDSGYFDQLEYSISLGQSEPDDYSEAFYHPAKWLAAHPYITSAYPEYFTPRSRTRSSQATCR